MSLKTDYRARLLDPQSNLTSTAITATCPRATPNTHLTKRNSISCRSILEARVAISDLVARSVCASIMARTTALACSRGIPDASRSVISWSESKVIVVMSHQPDRDCSWGFLVAGSLAKYSRTKLSTTKVNANSRSSESCFNSVHVFARILIVLCSIMILWLHNVCTVHNTILHFVIIKKVSL